MKLGLVESRCAAPIGAVVSVEPGSSSAFGICVHLCSSVVLNCIVPSKDRFTTRPIFCYSRRRLLLLSSRAPRVSHRAERNGNYEITCNASSHPGRLRIGDPGP